MTARGLSAWLDTVLAGSGWTAATIREAAARPDRSPTTAALADGFAAAARARAVAAHGGGGVR